MKIADLFPRKSASKKDRGGLTQAQASAIEKEFLDAFLPMEAKANQFFEHFVINEKHKWFLLPGVETIRDMSVERMAWILRYKGYFLNEVSKVILDRIEYEHPTQSDNATSNNPSVMGDDLGTQSHSGRCAR